MKAQNNDHLQIETENFSNSTESDLLAVNYEGILRRKDVKYVKHGSYLYVGEIFDDGWLLQISVVAHQMPDLLKEVIDYLIKSSLGFSIPENSRIHAMILDGGFGYEAIGKVITVYPSKDHSIITAAQFLLKTTMKFDGPEIPTAIKLGNCIYASFGLVMPSNLDSIRKIQSRWPFGKIAEFKITKIRKWLNRKYYIIQNLKDDAKGNVYKAFNLSKLTNISWCVLKQGKNNQIYDAAGRNIKDRLQWQFDIQSTLSNDIKVPKPIDYFEHDNDAYFVMDYIEGESYNDFISSIQGGITWEYMELDKQISLIHMLIQVVELVGKLHSKGFIHRDLSPENFIITPKNELYAIDVELCYNYKEQLPNPIYTLGTDGYMSPSQRHCAEPQLEDDTYGIGGLLIRTFTGMSPTKFEAGNGSELYSSLSFFIKNQRLLIMVCGCWESSADLRPSIQDIIQNLELYYSLLLTNNSSCQEETTMPPTQSLTLRFESGLRGLWGDPMFSESKTWLSKTQIDNPKISNNLKSVSWYPGLHTGVSGVLYFLSVADKLDYALQNKDYFFENFKMIKGHFERHENNENIGLFRGKAGAAILLANMINQGQLALDTENLDLIASYLHATTQFLNISEGICGIGIAKIKCAHLTGFPGFSSGLDEIVKTLLKNQNHDGSWAVKQNLEDRKGVKIYSLFHGIAGITYFLMLYGELYNSEDAKSAAEKALQWLIAQRKNINGHLIWTVNEKNRSIDPWLEYGFSGIAFLFLKAFELQQVPAYKEAAVNALNAHPLKITSNYFSQAAGLAGLGEIYLEAYNVLGENEWLDKAAHIAAFFTHTAKTTGNQECYWLDGSDVRPTPDFMTGNSGILHFLLRFQYPSKIKFPFLSI